MIDLADLGVNINTKDPFDRTALMIASTNGNLECIKFLVNMGADLSLIDARGNNMLDDAVIYK